MLCCFQVVGLLAKELKTRAHVDLKKKQDEFMWSKGIVEIKERYSCQD